MPLTNAQRQARHRNKVRNARHGMVTDDNGNPNSSLTRIATNLASGMNPSQALVAAGSSINARGLITKAQAGLATMLKAHNGHLPRLIEHAVKDLDAVKPVQLVDRCIDVPDGSRQIAARRDLLELNDRAGELPAPQAHPGHVDTVVHFHVHHPTHRQIPDVVVGDNRTIDITSEVNDSAP